MTSYAEWRKGERGGGGGKRAFRPFPCLPTTIKREERPGLGFCPPSLASPCLILAVLSLFLSFMLAALFRLSLLFPLFSFSLPSPSATGGNKLWPCSSSSSQRKGGDVVLYFIPLLARTSPSLQRRSSERTSFPPTFPSALMR